MSILKLLFVGLILSIIGALVICTLVESPLSLLLCAIYGGIVGGRIGHTLAKK